MFSVVFINFYVFAVLVKKNWNHIFCYKVYNLEMFLWECIFQKCVFNTNGCVKNDHNFIDSGGTCIPSAHQTDSNKYYRCENGVQVLTSCEHGYQFNTETGVIISLYFLEVIYTVTMLVSLAFKKNFSVFATLMLRYWT